MEVEAEDFDPEFVLELEPEFFAALSGFPGAGDARASEDFTDQDVEY